MCGCCRRERDEMKMVKRKSRAEIRTPDGAGGMSRIEDLRFEGGEWRIQLDVAGEEADQWLLRLGAECGKRGVALMIGWLIGWLTSR